jgi:hypothetical protein
VADVEWAGWAVAGQDAEALRVGQDLVVEIVTALEGCQL